MAKIPLTQGKVAIVDDADFGWLLGWNWCFDATGYAKRKVRIDGKQKTILMHRCILDANEGVEVDHINGDGLDNRRSNLRIVTSQQNKMNRHVIRGVSRFKGVTWNKQKHKWHSRIKLDSKYMHLGFFDNELDAAKAYNDAAARYFGQYAHLNQI